MLDHINIFINSLFTITKTEIVLVIMFSLYMAHLFVKNKDSFKVKTEFIQCDVIDNEVQWVYNNKIYYAKLNNNKIDMNTRKEISL